jgi:hypothetical protein
MIPSATLAALDGDGDTTTARLLTILDTVVTLNDDGIRLSKSGAVWDSKNDLHGTLDGVFTPDAWHTFLFHWTGTGGATVIWDFDGAEIFNYSDLGSDFTTINIEAGGIQAWGVAGEIYYLDNVRVGTTPGGSEIFGDDFESGTFSLWDDSGAEIVDDPLGTGGPGPGGGGGGGPIPEGRVGIAFDDGPLVADPTWTFIDALYSNLVAAIDTQSGKQTNRDSTDTGTATVQLNDTQGLFDPNNASSPYFGKLDGKQILIQIWNPVTAAWHPRWRGTIDDYGYVINPATNPDGSLVIANIQVDCVDVFDYLGGYELTPGLDGDTPPAAALGTVFYEDTAGTLQDRIIQILADTGVDSTRYVAFTGNVSVQETQYEAGSAALSALRDCADAEAPTIANIYCDRFGRFVFHGFYSRADPDGVAATTTPDIWDFQRWKLGDGLAVQADADRAQIRVLGYSRARSDIINAAVCWPHGMAQTDIPGQVFIDATSISDYGRHSAPPMTDLIIKEGTTSGFDAKTQCAKYAELLVKNQKDPTERITAIMLKSIDPSDTRAAKVWDAITRADISDIANVSVGYPAGTGIQDKDNYIEGVSCVIRPLWPVEKGGYDYVELSLDLTPAEWTMDTHGVFPPFS